MLGQTMQTADERAPAALGSLEAGADKLSLTAAAKLIARARPTLRHAIELGRIRAERIEHPSLGPHGVGFRILESELLEDLAALPICSHLECDERLLVDDELCPKHRRAIGRWATQAEAIAARRQREADLRAQGWTLPQIAADADRSITQVSLDLGLNTDARPGGEHRYTLAAAARRAGLTPEALREAIDDGRLRAEWGQDDRPGVRGSRTHWLIQPAELEHFLSSLEPCRYPGCDRPGHSTTGCCCGGHAIGVEQLGKPRSPDVGAKISAARRGKSYGHHSIERTRRIRDGLRRFYASDRSHSVRARARRRMSDPVVSARCQLIRWGKHGNGYARRAARRLEEALEEAIQRPIGGRPPKTELHQRWLAMFNGQDAELEQLLASDSMSRIRAIAWLDWQRHPEDWPRDKWFASRADPEDLDPQLLVGAAETVKKALQRAGTKP
jgi:hypothetical protein